MLDQFSRTKLVYGPDPVARLASCRVAIFGLGGVGGNVVEALARSGIGSFDLIDNDRVCLTNINRQILATKHTIGQYKVDAARARILSINPCARVTGHICFFLPETADSFDFTQYDYVVDAIDTVTGKLTIIEKAIKAGVPVISSMGCGNRTDPSKLVITDLYKTHLDPLSKVMRRECRKRGIDGLKVLFSEEPAIRPLDSTKGVGRYHDDFIPENEDTRKGRRSIPGSTAFVPPAAGILIASEVVKDLTGFDPGGRIS